MKRGRTTALVDRRGTTTTTTKPTAAFQSIYDLVCSKSTFESRENTVLRAVVFCLAVRFSDVMNKVGMSDRILPTSRALRSNRYNCAPKRSNWKQKSTSVAYV